jgi:hypothetical protein
VHQTSVHCVCREVGSTDKEIVVPIIVHVSGAIDRITAALAVRGSIEGEPRVSTRREVGQVQRTKSCRVCAPEDYIRRTSEGSAKRRALRSDNDISRAVAVNVACKANRAASLVVHRSPNDPEPVAPRCKRDHVYICPSRALSEHDHSPAIVGISAAAIVVVGNADNEIVDSIFIKIAPATERASKPVVAMDVLYSNALAAGYRSRDVDIRGGFSRLPEFQIHYSCVRLTVRGGAWSANKDIRISVLIHITSSCDSHA